MWCLPPARQAAMPMPASGTQSSGHTQADLGPAPVTIFTSLSLIRPMLRGPSRQICTQLGQSRGMYGSGVRSRAGAGGKYPGRDCDTDGSGPRCESWVSVSETRRQGSECWSADTHDGVTRHPHIACRCRDMSPSVETIVTQ